MNVLKLAFVLLVGTMFVILIALWASVVKMEQDITILRVDYDVRQKMEFDKATHDRDREMFEMGKRHAAKAGGK